METNLTRWVDIIKSVSIRWKYLNGKIKRFNIFCHPFGVTCCRINFYYSHFTLSRFI